MTDPNSSTVIGVVRFVDGWRLVSRGRRWGRFAHRAGAETAAWRLAALAQDLGQDVELIVQERHGELRRLSVG